MHKSQQSAKHSISTNFATLFFAFALAFACFGKAHAGWNGDGNINDLFSDIGSVQSTLNGNITLTSNDLSRQLDILNKRGFAIKASVDDLINWLEKRRDRYDAFVGSSCSSSTPCGVFREQLKFFTQDIAGLSDRFPVVNKLGIGDGSHIVTMLDIMPPFVLFAIYETMSRMPDWQQIPKNLADIYDEIDDPEVFSVDLSPRVETISASASATNASSETPTEKFCRKKNDKLDNEIDFVRVNRIRNFTFILKSLLDAGAEYVPEEAGFSVVGEGADGIPIPIKGILKTINAVISITENSIDTYRRNLDICRALKNERQQHLREIELQVAQCIMLDDFVRFDGYTEVHDLVSDQIDSAESDGIPVDKSRTFLATAEYKESRGDYKEAYKSLCGAYQKIGE